MDVQTQQRGPRIFSILNDNDCPSFVIRHQQPSSPASAKASPSISLRQRVERPHLPRQAGYTRASSFSSTGSTPPLLRQSSSESSSSMDSSPSPITPAYSYVDNTVLPYDPLLRQDLTGYLPSPSTITPFLEQQLMIAPNMTDPHYPGKATIIPPLTLAQYPIVPTSVHPSLPPLAVPSPATLHTPPTSAPAPSNQPTTSPTTNAAPPPKKNKYPCPYSQSHNCQATFTTSGHAARHGKKHTGEKGVHCPVCNKAFTRKDNMKQHERTHKGSQSGSNSDDSARRSKAAITKDAQKAKQAKKHDSMTSEASRRSSLIHSPLSEVTSLAPTAVETPVLLTDESTFYPEPPQMLMPIQTIPEGVSPNSLYPALGDDTLLNGGSMLQQPSMNKSAENGLAAHGLMPPTLMRGFSDLDTLAQAAESFDPYYPQSQGL